MTSEQKERDSRALGEGSPEVMATSARSGRPRERTCVGCAERVDKAVPSGAGAELVRLILGPDGEVAVDVAGGGFGRGAYVHPRRDCLIKAVQKGLPRVSKGKATTIFTGAGGSQKLTIEALVGAVRFAMTRKIHGLLLSAGRSKYLSLGADAVTRAMERGDAGLVLVACDAAAGAELPAVRRAISEGRAVAWGTKLELGTLCGGGRSHKQDAGIAVVAITSSRIAAALQGAVQAADACGGDVDLESTKKKRFGSAAGAAANRRAVG